MDIHQPMTGKSDEEAVAGLAAGESSEFRTLYDRYAARGRSYALSMLRNEADSEEAVQEAFCRLWKPVCSGTIDSSRGGFCAIFFATVRNHCIDMLRKRRPATCSDIDRLEKAPVRVGGNGETEPSRADDAAALESTVRKALAELPDRHAEALKLRLNGDLTYDQIAGILGCTKPQVRTWIYRARRKLEEKFRREGLINGKV